MRRVSKAWLEDANAVAPLTSYTARIHREINSKKNERVAARSVTSSPPSSQGSTSSSTPASATPPPRAGTDASRGSSGGELESDSIDRDLCPPRSWLKDSRFRECPGEEGMGLLKAGLRGLELSIEQEETGVGGGDEGAARKQWRRLNSYLAAVEVTLCVERGALVDPPATEDRAPVVVPFGLRPAEGVMEARVAARAVASGNHPCPSGGDDQRWDGWRVFAMAVVFASSEDRPFLCRSFQESAWGTSGLPRTQVIELLSRMCWCLRPSVQKRRQRQAAIGFQAASGVSTSTWDAEGSYRLRMDLVQCIYLMEAHFLRYE